MRRAGWPRQAKFLTRSEASRAGNVSMRAAFITLMALLLSGCSPRISGGSSSTDYRVSRDTVRLVVERRDTVRTGDTLRVFVRERGDTVRVWTERVKWRTRVMERRDTVWASRRDTVWRTRTETVTAERPRETGDWLWPMLTGAMGGAAAAAYLCIGKRRKD